MNFKHLRDLPTATLERLCELTSTYRQRTACQGEYATFQNFIDVESLRFVKTFTSETMNEIEKICKSLVSEEAQMRLVSIELLTAFNASLHVDSHEASAIFYNIVLRPDCGSIVFSIYDRERNEGLHGTLKPGTVFVFDPLIPHSLVNSCPSMKEILILQMVFHVALEPDKEDGKSYVDYKRELFELVIGNEKAPS